MPPSREREVKRNARTAWTYSGLTQPALAAKIGIKSRTLGGYLAASKPQVPDYETRLKIAEACGVPPSFMEEGFSEPVTADERVEELERDLGAVAVLLPLLLKAAGIRLPPAAVQALERVQRKRA
jgi:transcriptional regulator with XRE-family HTH domain